MKFIHIALALATLCLHATANLRGASNDGDNDRDLQGASAGASAGAGGPYEFLPGEYLVKFKSGTSQLNRGQAMSSSKSEVRERIVTPAMRDAGDDEGVTILRTRLGVPEAVRAMLASGTVEYAEPNYIVRHAATSNDPYSTGGSLWGMSSPTATGGGITNQFGIGATTAWQNDKTDCSAVYVGIIDEGVMFTHPDLAANAGTNPGEIAGDGIDNDNNGYIDDVNGWDFVNNDKTVYDGGSLDRHGTHVAGTIGGVGGNGIGVAGVCWKVKLLSGKFLGSTGGTIANAIKAVDYFTNLKKKGLNIVATNNSWGGGGYSTALYDAIQRANAADILFIAAAGNTAGQNNDVTPSYPSSYNNANIIAVASITSSGGLSSFSQFGPTSVDIGAPGSDIWSTVPGGYGSFSGTSMATPHVTGAAALRKALNPTATAAQIKAAILNGARPTTSLTGKVVTGGRLNVVGFLTPSPTGTITVQAESYSYMLGVIPEFTSDVGGGQNVGSIETGDWMSYPAVTIPNTGTYTVSYRVASLSGGGSLQLEKAGGTPVYGRLSIPSTGGWQSWTTVSHTVTLSAGSQSFGIKATGGGWNINWFTIAPAGTITVQAESYAGMFGVIIENTSDVGGGQNVGNIQTGDWMYYPAVKIPITGTYTVSYRVAALNSGGSLQLERAGGSVVYGRVSIPATGGYQTWTTISHIVTLSAGNEMFGILATGSGWNINWFTITKA
jgi:subtilisin family serine protease